MEKTVLVTGGAAGIGACISERFAKDGYEVGILDRDLEAAQALAERLTSEGGRAEAFLCDLSKAESIDRAVTEAHRAFGKIDILAGNCGVGGYMDWTVMTEEQWHSFTDVNVTGAFLCIQRVAQEMIRDGIRGKIILTLSQASYTQDETIVTPYCTSKWAERGLMRGAAAALSPYGITVNGVCPGTVWSPMMEGFFEEYAASTGSSKEEYIRFIESKYPTGRIQTGEDIAAMYAFLAGHSTHMTGQSVLVAGGIAFA